jgi:hypothetical protein
MISLQSQKTANLLPIYNSSPWLLSGNNTYYSNGFVGINNPNPSQNLDVSGNGKFSNGISGTIYVGSGSIYGDITDITITALGSIYNKAISGNIYTRFNSPYACNFQSNDGLTNYLTISPNYVKAFTNLFVTGYIDCGSIIQCLGLNTITSPTNPTNGINFFDDDGTGDGSYQRASILYSRSSQDISIYTPGKINLSSGGSSGDELTIDGVNTNITNQLNVTGKINALSDISANGNISVNGVINSLSDINCNNAYVNTSFYCNNIITTGLNIKNYINTNLLSINGDGTISANGNITTKSIFSTLDNNATGFASSFTCNGLRIVGNIGLGYNSIFTGGESTIIYGTTANSSKKFAIAPWINGTSGFYMNSSGKVGIGMNTPNESLDVVGNIQTSDSIKMTGFMFTSGSNLSTKTKIQTGTYTIASIASATYQQVNVTFTSSFLAAPVVTVSGRTTVSNYGYVCFHTILSVSTTGFSVLIYNISGATATSVNGYYTAIGTTS